ncbi:MAG: DUF167 domain-containing protein [Zoogloeaceae bacterium]|jgi:uncharacterized protein (TIGR00251 family)|nr:DUF167 domain-containing protein [Zoogloeaceae bacterium]
MSRRREEEDANALLPCLQPEARRENPADWCREDGEDACVLQLHIQPGAKRSEIAGRHGEALKIRLAAPPVEGKANAALIAFLADRLGLPRASIQLCGGASSRRKTVRIKGIDKTRLLLLAPAP